MHSHCTGADAAQRLVDALRDNCTSPTLAYLLQLRPSLWIHTETGEMLSALCKSIGIDCLQRPTEEFYDRIDVCASKMEPGQGWFYVTDRSKLGAVAKFRAALRERRRKNPDREHVYLGATMPFCFQTLRGRDAEGAEHTDSRFVLCSCPELGLRLVRDILAQGYIMCESTRKLVPVTQVYELRPDFEWLRGAEAASGNFIGCLIVDWEIKLSEVEGRGLARDDIEALGDSFSRSFYACMLKHGHVGADQLVTVTEKYKSRGLAGGSDWKASRHFVYNVCGTLPQLEHIIRSTMSEFSQEIKTFKDKSAEVRAAAFKGGMDDAWYAGFDFAGITGRTGFAMAGSRKCSSDPYPAVLKCTAYSRGEVHVHPRGAGRCNPRMFQPAPVDLQHDPANMPADDFVRLLYESSCSVLKRGIIEPSEKSLVKAEELWSRTTARHRASSERPPPAAAVQGGPGSSACAGLPEGIRKHIKDGPENRHSAQAYTQELLRLCVEGADPSTWNVVHLGHGRMPCVVKLADGDNPALHYHGSNGSVLALNPSLPGLAFMRCTFCSLPGQASAHVERVSNQHGVQSKWYKVTEEGYGRAVEDALQKISKGKVVEKVVKNRVKGIHRVNEVKEAAKKRKLECNHQKRSSSKVKNKLKVQADVSREIQHISKCARRENGTNTVCTASEAEKCSTSGGAADRHLQSVCPIKDTPPPCGNCEMQPKSMKETNSKKN